MNPFPGVDEMNRKLFTAGCLAAALFSSSAFAQEEPVEVRVRAIAKPDGKVEVVEERIVGPEKAAPKKQPPVTPDEDADKDENATLRARIYRRVQGLGEKVAEAAAGSERLNFVTEDVWGEMPASDYWIGVQIAPVASEIRKHMSVKHGVLVVHVYPDSPAVKADVKADDILLQAGDAKIETGPDLVKAIDAAKETEMSFLVLREGKEQKVTIAPKKREDATKTLGLYEKRHTDAFPQHSEKVQEVTKQLEKALATLRAESADEGTFDFMLVRPGAFLSRATTAKMPDDVTIQITKEGNKPAKVQVKKGDKSWEATADKLDSLPADIRPHVEQLMSGAGQGVLTLTAPTIEAREPSAFRMKVAPPAPNAPPMPYPPTAVIPAPYTTRLPTVTKAPAVAAVPATPAVPGMPPAVARAATAWSYAVSPQASDAKLDQILKKLDTLASPDLEDMKKELKALRKEVDELRKKTVER
jgi:hypothetical protein